MILEFAAGEDPKKTLERLTTELIRVKEELGAQKHAKENIERVVDGRKGFMNRIDSAKATLYCLIYDALVTETANHIDEYVALIETQCEILEAKEIKKEAKS